MQEDYLYSGQKNFTPVKFTKSTPENETLGGT